MIAILVQWVAVGLFIAVILALSFLIARFFFGHCHGSGGRDAGGERTGCRRCK